MRDRPIDILLLGNCLDQGTDVRTGTSFAELTLAAIRRRNPGVEIRFVRETLPHVTLLDRAVDHALRRGFEVVIVGAMTYSVQRSVRINRLWALDPRLAQGIVSTLRSIRRSSADSAPGDSAFEDRRWTEPLRVTIPQLSIEQYERTFDTQVARLRAARVEVVLRGNDGPHDRIVGESDMGVDEVLARVAARNDAFAFFPTEALTGDPRAMSQIKTDPKSSNRHGVTYVLNEDAHRLVARNMESAVGAAVDRVLAARIAGRPGVLARVEPPSDGLTTV